ncbi:MAG: hypothetical protein ACPGTP_07640, partial [Bacteroidia bacterium]
MLKQVDNFIKSEVYKSLKNNPQKNYYRLLGLRRSGNHAFINWLLPQIEGITLFVDNVQRGDPNNNVNKKLQVRGLDPMNLLISHEDRELEAFYLGHQERWYGNSSRTVTMVILRDPYNWMASWYAWTDNLGHQFRKDKEFRDRTIELWKKYATLCLQWQSNDESEKRQEQKVFINYNQWASSIDYRQSMAKKLGLTENTQVLNIQIL